MASYQIFASSIPPTLEEVTNYRSLRLLALQSDPNCFSSTYEREEAFTESKWKERLSFEHKAVIVARDTSTRTGGTEGGWVGTATFVAPEGITDIVLPTAESDKTYVVFAMWVHPEHRGKGIGKRLIKEGFEWVKRRREEGLHDEKNAKRTLLLEVHKENEAGVALYRSVGFDELGMGERSEGGSDSSEPGTMWMARVV